MQAELISYRLLPLSIILDCTSSSRSRTAISNTSSTRTVSLTTVLQKPEPRKGKSGLPILRLHSALLQAANTSCIMTDGCRRPRHLIMESTTSCITHHSFTYHPSPPHALKLTEINARRQGNCWMDDHDHNHDCAPQLQTPNPLREPTVNTRH